jgi:hypothetical protein
MYIHPHPHTLYISISLYHTAEPLSGTSLLVDGNAFFFWVMDSAFKKDYAQWMGGYQCFYDVAKEALLQFQKYNVKLTFIFDNRLTVCVCVWGGVDVGVYGAELYHPFVHTYTHTHTHTHTHRWRKRKAKVTTSRRQTWTDCCRCVCVSACVYSYI